VQRLAPGSVLPMQRLLPAVIASVDLTELLSDELVRLGYAGDGE
jgi:hypothetical protein